MGYTMPYSTYSGYKPYTWPYTYSSWPYTTPYHHLGKREAEAEPEADPALIYSSVGHMGYTMPYSTYSGYKPYTWPYTYSSWPYTTPYHHLGKREAEAEPEADPALLYLLSLHLLPAPTLRLVPIHHSIWPLGVLWLGGHMVDESRDRKGCWTSPFLN